MEDPIRSAARRSRGERRCLSAVERPAKQSSGGRPGSPGPSGRPTRVDAVIDNGASPTGMPACPPVQECRSGGETTAATVRPPVVAPRSDPSSPKPPHSTVLWTVRTTGTAGHHATARWRVPRRIPGIPVCRWTTSGRTAPTVRASRPAPSTTAIFAVEEAALLADPNAPGGEARGHLVAVGVVAGGDDRKERDLVALGGAGDGEQLRDALRATESEMCHDMEDAHSGLMGSSAFGGRRSRRPSGGMSLERPTSRRRGRRSPGSDVPYRLIVVLEGVARSMPVAFEASPTGTAPTSPTPAVGTDAGPGGHPSSSSTSAIGNAPVRTRCSTPSWRSCAGWTTTSRPWSSTTTPSRTNRASRNVPDLRSTRSGRRVPRGWYRSKSPRGRSTSSTPTTRFRSCPRPSTALLGDLGRPWCRRSTTIERCARQRPSFATDGLARTASDGPCLGRRCCTPATAGRGSRPSRWPPWWPPIASARVAGCRCVHRPDGFRRRQAG